MHQRILHSWNALISAGVRHGERKEALRLFEQLLHEGLLPDKVSFVSILSAFTTHSALNNARKMHVRVIGSGFEFDCMVGTALIHMYGKCGSLESAWSTFEKMPTRNVISWNAIITVCAQHKKGGKALRLFRRMGVEGIMLSKVTFVSVLNACASKLCVAEGENVHALIIGSRLESDVIVGTALVNMYGKCGNLSEARMIFDKLNEPTVVSWTAMITACGQNGCGKEALQQFSQMLGKGVIPNKITLISLLDVCANHASLSEGRQIHVLILSNGFESDVVIGNALVNMYGKCACVEAAQNIFYSMPQQDVLSWNCMISAYTTNGNSLEAMELFEDLQQIGILPSKVTFISMVDACANRMAVLEGEWVHSCIVDSGFESDLVLGNALLSMYSKCSSLKDAVRIYDKMIERDTITLNAMIAAYTQHGKGNAALQLFNQMFWEGIMPNKVTFINILSACTNLDSLLGEGGRMHVRICSNGFDWNIAVQNSLVNMYGKSGNLLEAERVFDSIVDRNSISWNAMMSVYAQNQKGKEAIHLFNQMLGKGVVPDKVTYVCLVSACASQGRLVDGQRMHICILSSGIELDVFVGNALVSMYSRCNSLKGALGVFANMFELDVVSWNAMIAMFAQHGQGTLALLLFDRMQQEGMLPDRVTFVSTLDACACQLVLITGKQVHARIIGSHLELEVVLGTALLKFYGSCGHLEVARQKFDEILEQNLVSWNAMLTAYAQSGQGKDALQLFRQMQQNGVVPDKITFTSILSACSHDGLVDQALHLFPMMEHNLGVSPIVDHYNCMVDLLGRTGRLEEAEHSIRKMPFKPTFVSIITLLAACRYHADVERRKQAARQVCQLQA